MNFNYAIHVNGTLTLHCTDSDLIDKIITHFSNLKNKINKQNEIKSKLETFKNLPEGTEIEIDGMIFVKAKMIEPSISQSKKENEKLNTTEDDPGHKTEKELLHERLSQKHAPIRIPQNKSKGMKLKM